MTKSIIQHIPQRRSSILCALLSFCALYFLDVPLKTELTNYAISNSIFAFPLFFGIFFLLKKGRSVMDRRMAPISLVLGALFSVMMAFGSSLIQKNTISYEQPRLWLGILSFTPVFAACTALVLHGLSQANTRLRWARLDELCGRLSPRSGFALSWALIFLAWVPALIASYPGIYGYDSVHQIGGYIDGTLNLWHPLAHNLVAGFFTVTIGDLFHSRTVGMLLYSLFQMLVLSGAFAATTAWMRRQKISALIRLMVMGLFMFLPTHAVMSFSLTKDVLFSAFFLLLVLYAIELAQHYDRPSVDRRLLVKFLIAALLTSLFRKQAMYIIPVGLFVGLLFLPRCRKQLLAVSLAWALLFGLYSGPFTKATHAVDPGNQISEMMSVPCMQLSRTMLYNKDELSPEEIAFIEHYFPDYGYYPIAAGISDAMRVTFATGAFKQNPSEFFRMWIQIGLKCPGTYITAFLRTTIGLWYPDMNYRDPQAYHPYWEYDNTPQNAEGTWVILERTPPEAMSKLTNYLHDLAYFNTYQKTPLVSMLYSSGLASWCLLLFAAWCLYARKYRYLFPAAFPAMVWVTQMLGPVVLYRYVYPIIVVLPLLLSIVMQSDKKEKETHHG